MIESEKQEFFESKPPDVKLVGMIASPYDLSVATARTCYSATGIITPQQVSQNEEARLLRDRIAASTRHAGHLTTRQHAHFVFALNRVSRHFLWEFLHSHPFYNSEQVSQRYVKVKAGNFTIPKMPADSRGLYEKILNLQMGAYEKLIALLIPAVTEQYYHIFPNRRSLSPPLQKNKKKSRRLQWESAIQKKAYEIARYVLPIATQAYLYHTVSALTLIRYYSFSQLPQTPFEQKYIVSRMVEEVIACDPDFRKDLSLIPSEKKRGEEWRNLSVTEEDFAKVKRVTHSFDQELGGKVSRLIDVGSDAEHTLARAVRLVLAKTTSELSDKEAVELVLNPAKNRSLGDTLNITTLSPLGRALSHVHFTFLKKMSHTADSQNQRHRMTPATRPFLGLHYFGEPDVVYPRLLEEVSEAKKLYEDVVNQTVEAINLLLKKGISFERAQYLLPNGWKIRFMESGDLLHWHHKWKLRTCYNAQEEIFYASVDELREISKKFPAIGRHILAPCYLRKQARLSPYCPEGDRYCGVPVWNLQISEYQRLI